MALRVATVRRKAAMVAFILPVGRGLPQGEQGFLRRVLRFVQIAEYAKGHPHEPRALAGNYLTIGFGIARRDPAHEHAVVANRAVGLAWLHEWPFARSLPLGTLSSAQHGGQSSHQAEPAVRPSCSSSFNSCCSSALRGLLNPASRL